ncbi:RNA polymerase sigma factor [Longimicrobium sp.]|uniref:RNA polymerase sigma factor n=1 Tax=Longimicrobium sp. TaxID=2029185 RepID=UPI003B3A02BB
MPDSTARTGLVELAAAEKDGCEHALERLLAHVHVHVVRACRRWLAGIGDGAAEEVAQEALVRIAAGLQTCRAGTDEVLFAWCHAVARHAAMDRLREHLREWEVRALGDELAEVECGADADERSAAVGALLAVLHEALGTEPEAVHALLWHRVVRRDSWEEVGHALGLTAAGAKRRFQRTVARVRRKVERLLAQGDDPGRTDARRWLARQRHGLMAGKA